MIPYREGISRVVQLALPFLAAQLILKAAANRNGISQSDGGNIKISQVTVKMPWKYPSTRLRAKCHKRIVSGVVVDGINANATSMSDVLCNLLVRLEL